ncbi:MAG: UDP-glucose 4-epimerase GalE [Nisaea sp.]|uniref:UDP-glucose 4-epimerase GalE n=1 Tax=Nisaea sp. TaxID=2024842 RepID=UPI001B0B8D0E|nr:UDP-glucose 4-epimerase GalE [Nisaea sp.]MBO6560814.1 UDP-glucose 4-epimerase GalE [Nisaea sp.]
MSGARSHSHLVGGAARPAVLVTGGAGFIGSHTCKALSRAGYLPVTYDDLSNGIAAAVRWGPLEIGDIRDEARLYSVMTTYRPEAVLHFAGLIEAGTSVREPLDYYDVNVCGSQTLLRCMRRSGIDRIVFSSTAAVYGEPEIVPIPETHPRRPINPYGRSKNMVEDILADAAAAYGLRYCALRYFNAAGADPDGELRENHDPETHLIPLAIQAALGLRDELVIFGTDYDTPDGTCIRDYVHVSDLAEGHVLAVRRLLDGGGNLTANLGIGRGFSVRQVSKSVEAVIGKPMRVREASRRSGDPARLIASASLVKKELKWNPQHCRLIDQVRHAACSISSRTARRNRHVLSVEVGD